MIGRALAALTDGGAAGELEVIVVCNGCSDDTVAIASRFGPPVRVVVTKGEGKTAALNIGDRVARGFPRIYMDADVVITLDAVRVLADRLCDGEVLAAAPTAKVSLVACSWFVRAFFEIRSRLPSAREGIGGSGV